jgi:hypothetical protein
VTAKLKFCPEVKKIAPFGRRTQRSMKELMIMRKIISLRWNENKKSLKWSSWYRFDRIEIESILRGLEAHKVEFECKYIGKTYFCADELIWALNEEDRK